VFECIKSVAQFKVKVKVKSTNDMPTKKQREGGGVAVTIRKPAVEGSWWSAPRCGHFNSGKARVPMAQKTEFKIFSRNFPSCAEQY